MSDENKRFSQEQELNNKILSSINQSFSGEETRRWIVALEEDDIVSAEEPIAQGARDGQNATSMTKVIERLFDNFKRYSFEFNRTQEDRELEVFCERPSSMRMTAEYMELGVPIKFCLGTLSTRQYSLIVQGEEKRIRAFIVPVEYMIGFKPGQTEFKAHLDMKLAADRSASDAVWLIDGQILSLASLPALSRRLFTQLIKVSKGESNFEEKFVFNPEEKEAPKSKDIDRSFEGSQAPAYVGEAPKVDASKGIGIFQDKPGAYAVAATAPNQADYFRAQKPPVSDDLPKNPLESEAQPRWQAVNAAALAQQNLPKPPADSNQSTFGQVYKDPGSNARQSADLALPVLPQEPTQLAEPQPAQVSAPSALANQAIEPVLPQPSAVAAVEAAPATQIPVTPTLPPAAPQFFNAAQSEDLSQQAIGGEKNTAEISRKVAHSIKNLFDTLDGSIASLTKLGVEAMHRDDIDGVQEIMRHAKTLKTLRDGVVQISKDWQKTL